MAYTQKKVKVFNLKIGKSKSQGTQGAAFQKVNKQNSKDPYESPHLWAEAIFKIKDLLTFFPIFILRTCKKHQVAFLLLNLQPQV